MAKITRTGINPLVVPLHLERGLDTEGPFEIHELVRKVYQEKNYQNAPTSSSQGLPFNGLQVSVADIAENPATIWLAPTRYYFCKAMSEVYKKNKDTLSAEELRKISPKIAHTSIKSLVKYDGKLHIPCHIRGKGAYGTGTILSVLAAGGIEPKHLNTPNPLLAALKDEIKEEIGIDDINLLNPNYAFDLYEEEEVGRVNFSMYAQNINLSFIMHNVMDNNKRIKDQGKKSEISGFALLPFDKPSLRLICDRYQIEGIALLPFEKPRLKDILNQDSFTKIPCYIFDSFDSEKIIETSYEEYSMGKKQRSFFRPITQATLVSIINDSNFMKYYQEQSGH